MGTTRMGTDVRRSVATAAGQSHDHPNLWFAGASLFPTSGTANPTLTMSMLGVPDGVGCSIGRDGEVVLDLGPTSVVTNGVGDDLTVTESTEDTNLDGFSLYGGDDYLGPWTLIGSALGTTSFDLAGTGLTEARYLRVVDDGDGSASDPHAGFDLDAIWVVTG